ncbi:hypothetical protein [Roseomonas populi]|uniref:TetR family transcriptional regulator n=1 Tax=Roseomonas populi TaxID=3121582 RepID=A0ABT1X0N7_9PROT|nr:hypothetical protein [Roseomonas pecuniae]MCR0981671.1 hypothetical protein [Roseomonas pecuniae]
MTTKAWPRAGTLCGEQPERRAAMQEGMARHLISEAVRTVLEEGLRHAPDPVAYLRRAAGEVLLVITAFEAAGPSEGAELRAIVAEEIVTISHALMKGCQN